MLHRCSQRVVGRHRKERKQWAVLGMVPWVNSYCLLREVSVIGMGVRVYGISNFEVEITFFSLQFQEYTLRSVSFFERL